MYRGLVGLLRVSVHQKSVAPAQAGAHDVFPPIPTGAIGPSLGWGDGGDDVIWRLCKIAKTTFLQHSR